MSRPVHRDPFLAAYVGLLVLTGILIQASPLPSDAAEAVGGLTSEMLPSLLEGALSILAAGALWIARAHATSRRERAFWGLSTAAFVMAAAVHVLGIGSWTSWTFRTDLIQDVLFAGFYVALSLGLELRIVGTPSDAYRGVRTVRIAATALFILGLFTYFVLIPGFLARDVYDTWVPSFFFYCVLDLHLVVRLAGLYSRSDVPPWRRVYLGLLASFVLWAVCDALEMAGYAGFVTVPGGGLGELLWTLPYVPILWASRQPATQPPEGEDREPTAETYPDSRLAHVPVLVTQPLFYAAVLPVLHFAGGLAGFEDAATHLPREVTLLITVPLLAALSFLHHRALERENERLQDERSQVAGRIQEGQRMEAVGRLAGGVAHDFNNLMQVIRSSNELLLRRMEEEHPARKHAEEIQSATAHAVLLTDQLLAVGRRKPLDQHPVDVNEVVVHATSLIGRVIGEDVRVELVTRPGAGRVCVDRPRLESGILNLAINARDAMPEGGTLSIETGREVSPETGEEWVTIEVRDTGVGMSESTRARIFEPFFTTKEVGKGTGLGLSMLYGFVEQCAGRIEVRSAVGAGTTIRLLLPPFAESVEPEPAAAPAPPVEITAPRGRKTVLVVEDEGGVRSVLHELLEEHGYHVLEARDGEQALALLEGGARPDLLLTDVLMPGMRGTELVELVRRRHPEAKILYMTGNAGQETGSAHMAGFPILEKPFTRDTLTRSVDALLAPG